MGERPNSRPSGQDSTARASASRRSGRSRSNARPHASASTSRSARPRSSSGRNEEVAPSVDSASSGQKRPRAQSASGEQSDSDPPRRRATERGSPLAPRRPAPRPPRPKDDASDFEHGLQLLGLGAADAPAYSAEAARVLPGLPPSMALVHEDESEQESPDDSDEHESSSQPDEGQEEGTASPLASPCSVGLLREDESETLPGGPSTAAVPAGPLEPSLAPTVPPPFSSREGSTTPGLFQ